MSPEYKWEKATPEWHIGEAQRLVDGFEQDRYSVSALTEAQVHATIAAAMMTDRLDATLTKLEQYIGRMRA